MRILVLTNMYPPHAYGGYELWCQDVVGRWARRGHRVLVLTSRVAVPGANQADVEAADAPGGVSVRRELHLYWHDHVVLHPALHRRVLWERSNQVALRRALADFQPDVASVWAMGAMSFGLLTTISARGLPAVQVVCDEWPVYGPEMDAWIRLFPSRPVAARVTSLLTGVPTRLPDLDALGHCCFASAFLQRAVRTRSRWGFADASIVPSGIDSGDFPYADSDGGPWRWRLLYVGRIDSRKGIDTVVRAVGLCPPEATLVVCGRGDNVHLEALQRLAQDSGLGDRVRFTSSPRSELGRYYRSADAVVFPSVWDEPFGLVPLEAMSCGTPVVATAVGGAAEFLGDGENCLTFLPGDPESLVDALRRLAVDPSLRTALVSGGRRTAQEYDVDPLADELEAWHGRAVAPD